MSKPTPIERYLVVAGSRKEAARRLGVSTAMVDHLVSGIRGVSVRLAKRINEDTNGLIPLHELRPDIWAPMDRAA